MGVPSFSALVLTLVLLLAAGGRLVAALPPGLEPGVQTYLEQHCVKCHGAEKQKGEFRVDTLSMKVGFENTPQWLEIMERINSGEMPPKKEKERPTAEESAKVVEWLADRMKEGESARMAARGRVSYNRLTRDEYVNTVRDLIGVHFDATDPGGFLEDPEWHGFERIGSVLTLSPSNIEKYLAAAEVVLAEAYPAEAAPVFRRDEARGAGKSSDERHRERLRTLGLLDKVRFEMWAGDIFRGTNLQEPLPEAGIYEISYTLSGLKPEKGRAPRLMCMRQSWTACFSNKISSRPKISRSPSLSERICRRGGRTSTSSTKCPGLRTSRAPVATATSPSSAPRTVAFHGR